MGHQSTSASTYRHAWIEKDLQRLLHIKVVHRNLRQRMHAMRRRLPNYAMSELAEVHDRSALLNTVPSQVVPVWIEGELSEAESVSVPLTGWGVVAEAPLTILHFDSMLADLDTPPLLAAITNGVLQLATEIHLLLGNRILRVWRYGARFSYVHGSRTIRMMSKDEQSSFRGWQARSDEGTVLLKLDVPSAGTDGLADLWHVSALQLAIPTHELYLALVPNLFPRFLSPPESSCLLQLSFHKLDGSCLARTSFWSQLEIRAVSIPREQQRRVKVALATIRHGEPLDCNATAYMERAGIVCLQLYQGGHFVLAVASHFSDALSTPVVWSVGEAEYQDQSGVTHREPMESTFSIERLQVLGAASFASDASPVGTERSVNGQESPEARSQDHLRWRLDRIQMSIQIPLNFEEDGVVFKPTACEQTWMNSLRHVAMRSTRGQ